MTIHIDDGVINLGIESDLIIELEIVYRNDSQICFKVKRTPFIFGVGFSYYHMERAVEIRGNHGKSIKIERDEELLIFGLPLSLPSQNVALVNLGTWEDIKSAVNSYNNFIIENREQLIKNLNF